MLAVGNLHAPGGGRGSPHLGNLAVGAGPPSRVPRRPRRWRAAAEVGAGAEAVVGAGYSLRRHLESGVGTRLEMPLKSEFAVKSAFP